MISFFLTVFRLIKAILHVADDAEFSALAFLNLTLLLSGSVFYYSVENWSALDAVYFCVMTMTTIGYGDLAPTSDLSKIFTIIYSFVSIGVFILLAVKLASASLKNKSAS